MQSTYHCSSWMAIENGYIVYIPFSDTPIFSMDQKLFKYHWDRGMNIHLTQDQCSELRSVCGTAIYIYICMICHRGSQMKLDLSLFVWRHPLVSSLTDDTNQHRYWNFHPEICGLAAREMVKQLTITCGPGVPSWTNWFMMLKLTKRWIHQ